VVFTPPQGTTAGQVSLKQPMKIQNSIPTTVRAVALACAFSLAAVSTSHAVFVDLPSPTPEVPGVLLGGLTATGGGTIVEFLSSPFLNAFNGGILNTCR